MKTKTKYILLILSIITFSLLTFNSVKMQYWYNVKLELDIAKFLFVIGLISFGFYFLAKGWRNVLTKIMIGVFGICLVLNLHLWAEYDKAIQKQKRLTEYYELENCEKMENRFEVDLKKGELKYFHFGLGSIIGMENIMESEYNIEYYSMGCILRSEMECYNKLVDKHLKKNFNKSVSDIQKETDFYKLIETE
ncbi:FEKKY domain-containing protein [Tenacibaculum geojense]|uniref:Uncharacterized protein n=1 Tax=Tenacibaculum geojense TaxID=915352 RepID=A0ABW3JR40_9FLAO